MDRAPSVRPPVASTGPSSGDDGEHQAQLRALGQIHGTVLQRGRRLETTERRQVAKRWPNSVRLQRGRRLETTERTGQMVRSQFPPTLVLQRGRRLETTERSGH